MVHNIAVYDLHLDSVCVCVLDSYKLLIL